MVSIRGWRLGLQVDQCTGYELQADPVNYTGAGVVIFFLAGSRKWQAVPDLLCEEVTQSLSVYCKPFINYGQYKRVGGLGPGVGGYTIHVG